MSESDELDNGKGQVIYVLLDEPSDVAKFGAPKEIDADKLGEHLDRLSSAVSRALGHVKSLAGEFQLSEISLEAKLSTEVGLVLVSKAGVEGAVKLKFVRQCLVAEKAGEEHR